MINNNSVSKQFHILVKSIVVGLEIDIRAHRLSACCHINNNVFSPSHYVIVTGISISDIH